MENNFNELVHRYEPAEIFYKDLAEKKSEGGEIYRRYLETLDAEELKRKGLVVPDLFPPFKKYPEYRAIFPENNDIAVWKHSRYTPVYMHSHEYFEIICVTEGEVYNRFEGGEPMPMAAGDILILPDGIRHELSVMNDDGIVINIMIKKSTFKYVFFDVISSDDLLSRFFQDALYGESGMPYLYFRTGCDPNVRKCIEDAFLEYYNHRKYYEKVTKSQVNCLFAYLLRSRESYLIAGGEHKELEIYEYIRRHFMDMSLESAAKDFGYSSAYFSRYIRKITGRTYSDLVTEYRMETAVRLLRTTALSVSQISEITGYGSEEHFIRQFKKLNGKTPAAYRKENRNI